MPRYTEIPTKHQGERELAQQLDGMQDRACHFWFGVDYLPGVPDIDILLLHERIGLFLIEVKAVPLSAIVEFGLNVCEIKGRPREKSPQLNAYNVAVDFRNYLRGRMQLPFVVATACWPRIQRRRWNEAMRHEPRISGEFAERMIFQEDLTAGPTVLRDRLRRVHKTPPVRIAPRYAFTFDPVVLSALQNELSVQARPHPIPSDLARLRSIEGNVTSEALRQAPPAVQRQLLYTGHPGTGKTFRLLQIGLRHALAGRSVLLVCYNKVLATDLRRLMSFSQELRLASGSFEIRDAFEELRHLSAGLQIEWPMNAEDHDEWAELVLSELQAQQRGALYDTVLADEGQDLRDWAFMMLEWLAKPAATMAVAVGRGQELYGATALWLDSYKTRAREHALRRNFRNTRPVFQLAQVIYEAGTDLSRIERAVGKIRRQTGGTDQLEFLREQGDLPRICYLDDSPVATLQPFDAAYAQVQHETMVLEYERVLRAELAALRDDEWPVDLLVLIPASQCLEREWAAEAIRRMQEEYDFLDYTDSKQRRVPARKTDLRLCTYHSSRGIEGSRVLIFGLEHLTRVAESIRVSEGKLAYIALSRSIAESIIVLPRSQARQEVGMAIERTLVLLEGDAASHLSHVPPSGTLVHDYSWIRVTDQALKFGDIVRHEEWGQGRVVAQLAADRAMRLVIDFEGDGGTQNVFIPPSVVELRLA